MPAILHAAAPAPDTLICFAHDRPAPRCDHCELSAGRSVPSSARRHRKTVSIVPRSLEQIRSKCSLSSIEGEAPRAPSALLIADDRSAIVRNFVPWRDEPARSAKLRRREVLECFRLGGIARLSRDRWSMFPISQPIKPTQHIDVAFGDLRSLMPCRAVPPHRRYEMRAIVERSPVERTLIGARAPHLRCLDKLHLRRGSVERSRHDRHGLRCLLASLD